MKAFVLIRKDADTPMEIVGLYSEAAKKKEILQFAHKEQAHNRLMINELTDCIDVDKKERYKLTQEDYHLIYMAGKHFSTMELKMHTKNLAEINRLTESIAEKLNAIKKIESMSVKDLAASYMERNGLEFQEHRLVE